MEKAAHAYAAAKRAYAAAAAIITAVVADGVTTEGAGAVEVVFLTGTEVPEGFIDVDSSGAGLVKCTRITGPADGAVSTGGSTSTLPCPGVTPGLRVNATRAGSVEAHGVIKGVNTSYAGSVKISFAGAVGDGKKRATETRICLPLAILVSGVVLGLVYGSSFTGS